MESTFDVGPIEPCRLCLKSGPHVTDASENATLVSKIEDCVSIKIKPDDEYPKRICTLCIEKVDCWHTFKTICLRSKTILESRPDERPPDTCKSINNIQSIAPKLPSPNKKVSCSKCAKLVQKQSLRLHLIRHSDKFKCDQCNLSFSCQPLLTAHVSAKHLKLKRFFCNPCGKGFATKSSLTVHMKVHSSEALFKCDQCPYATKTSGALKTHKSKHERGSYVCQNCPKVFKSNRNLRDHLARVHSLKKRVRAFRYFSFCSRYVLEQHKRVHTGVRPYRCHKCSKAFTRSDGLKEHLLVHESETSYQCDLCGWWVNTRKVVKRHKCHETTVVL